MNRTASLSLAADTASVGAARRFMRETLVGWHAEGYLDTATLLLSELVTNAVLHARSAPRVVVRLGDRNLRIEVHDDSAVAPARKRYGIHAGTGRGIGLVEDLAAAWGSTRDAGGTGKVVWFELDRSAAIDQEEASAAAFGAGVVDRGRAAGPAGDPVRQPGSDTVLMCMA